MGRKNRRIKEHIRRLPKLSEIITPKRMDIWYAKLPMDRRTSVQGGSRPVLIISNDICNENSPVVTVVPLTTQFKHLGQPTHVMLKLRDGTQSMLLAEQIMTVEKKLLDRKIEHYQDGGTIRKIETAIREQIGMRDGDTS